MTLPRKQQIDLDRTPFYHCLARCVRRAFLCGNDRLSGKNYDHRRQWLVDRMKLLTSVFNIRIAAYAVLSNHYHLVLYVDKDAALDLTDQQVVDRWNRLLDQTGSDKRKKKQAKDRIFEVPVLRERLYDISWFMRFLNENIARKANAEDRCKGHFWEGRFRSQALLDEGALLTCMTYVDLNPIRAGMALTPEASSFTSIQERIHSYWKQQKLQNQLVEDYTNQQAYPLGTGLMPCLPDDPNQPLCDDIPIPVTRREYFELVDWTGRQMKDGKKGAIPNHLIPILHRLDLDDAKWVGSVQGYRQRFFLMVGRFPVLQSMAESLNKGWFKGQAGVKGLYRHASPS